MTDNYASKLKQTLTDCISEVNNVRHLFCKNPKTDFTRSRKMPLIVFFTAHDTDPKQITSK